jgi:COMPASS component SWD2
MTDEKPLTPAILSNMKCGAVLPGSIANDEGENSITSLDFHTSGEFCVTSSQDGTIQQLNAHTGKVVKTCQSKKYGLGLVCYTHHNQSIIHSSNPGSESQDHDLRYLSLYDNKYLRFFKGHTDKVHSVKMSPESDLFVSGSRDQTVRVWTLESEKALGVLHIPGNIFPCVTLDPTGAVFAATTNEDIRLFDIRDYDKGPFDSFRIDRKIVQKNNNSSKYWNPISIDFSPDGSSILVGTDHAFALRLDAYNGAVKNRYEWGGSKVEGGEDLHMGGTGNAHIPSFTPDSKYVMSGTSDGAVVTFDAQSGEEVARWTGHAGPVTNVRWNPKTMMAASTCSNTMFWIDDDGEVNAEGGAAKRQKT